MRRKGKSVISFSSSPYLLVSSSNFNHQSPLPRLERKRIHLLNLLPRFAIGDLDELLGPFVYDGLGVGIPGQAADAEQRCLLGLAIGVGDDDFVGRAITHASFHRDGADVVGHGAKDVERCADEEWCKTQCIQCDFAGDDFNERDFKHKKLLVFSGCIDDDHAFFGIVLEGFDEDVLRTFAERLDVLSDLVFAFTFLPVGGFEHVRRVDRRDVELAILIGLVIRAEPDAIERQVGIVGHLRRVDEIRPLRRLGATTNHRQENHDREQHRDRSV